MHRHRSRVGHHSDPEHLEAVIRRAIIEGQPRTHRPWTKILVVVSALLPAQPSSVGVRVRQVEGIYSMEGEICPLPEILKVTKKYRVLTVRRADVPLTPRDPSATCTSMRRTASVR